MGLKKMGRRTANIEEETKSSSSNQMTLAGVPFSKVLADDLNKKEILALIYWIRQIISIIFGIVFGWLPVRGYLPMLIYLAATSLAMDNYFRFHRISNTMDRTEALKEGMLP